MSNEVTSLFSTVVKQIKSLVTVFSVLFFIYSLVVTVDRLYWVNAGSGLGGWVAPSVLQDASITQCGDEGAEFKMKGDRLIYRCGNIVLWPFWVGRNGESEKLKVAINEIEKRAKAR